RPAGHRADGAGREHRHRRLLAGRRRIPGGGRPCLASGGRHHHRRPPARHVRGDGGDRPRGRSALAPPHRPDPGRPDDRCRGTMTYSPPEHPGRAPMTSWNEATTPPPPPVGTPDAQERQWAMFAHLSALVGGLLTSNTIGGIGCVLGPLIIWQVKKDTMPFVTDQAKEALNFTVALAMLVLVLLGV